MPPFQEPVFKRSSAGRVGGGSWGRFWARGAGRSVPPGPGAAAEAVSGERVAGSGAQLWVTRGLFLSRPRRVGEPFSFRRSLCLLLCCLQMLGVVETG